MAITLQDQLQQALGNAYELERELAPGGMSRLYLASERSLERRVVVKLLPPELASEVSAERFRREMLVTARLQHPHILPVLNAGAREGLLYYVMPYVPGESLRARLQREGRLPVAEVARILHELADALVCAHGAGVVHRDVKPENVLLQHNHAILADFGVAAALQHAALGERLTGTGLGIGTLGYMAPEQLAGEPGVDARVDLYALGVLAYEMLAGGPPFGGATPQRVLAAHLSERPRPLGVSRPDVPAALAALVMKLLAKEAAERPQTAEEVLRALEVMATQSRARPKVPSTRSTSHDASFEFLFAWIAAFNVRLTDEQVAWIKAHFVPRTFRKGQFYQRAGEVTTHGAMVARGLFRTYAIDASGSESITGFTPENGWIGDIQSATTGAPTLYFVEAIEPSDVLMIDLPSFNQLLEANPQWSHGYRLALQRGRASMERRIALSLHASAEERYANFVERYPALVLRVPQRMLASYLGITPETLSRVRRKFKEG